jgi:beta-lactam-binding protein with PASTA domain
VPDVIGMSRSNARAHVQAAGLRYYEIPRPDSDNPAPRGKIYDQQPHAGELIDAGADVYVLYGVR